MLRAWLWVLRTRGAGRKGGTTPGPQDPTFAVLRRSPQKALRESSGRQGDVPTLSRHVC